MDVFQLAIPDCPERTNKTMVDKSILRYRLDTVEKYYKTYADAPEANLFEWKHARTSRIIPPSFPFQKP